MFTMFNVSQVTLVSGGGALVATFDLSLGNPGDDRDQQLKIKRCGFFRTETGKTFVAGPSFKVGRPDEDDNQRRIKPVYLPQSLNDKVTDAIIGQFNL
jgi:hypothetical protein